MVLSIWKDINNDCLGSPMAWWGLAGCGRLSCQDFLLLRDDIQKYPTGSSNQRRAGIHNEKK